MAAVNVELGENDRREINKRCHLLATSESGMHPK